MVRSHTCSRCKGEHANSLRSLRAPPEVVLKVIGNLPVRYERPNCGAYVALQCLSTHIEQGCTPDAGHVQDPTLSQLLMTPNTTAATDLEKRVASYIIQRMIGEGKDIRLPTARKIIITQVHVHTFKLHSCQPLHLVKVTKGEVESTKTSSKTVHRRCQELGGVRDLISGGSSSLQLAEEVKVLSSVERRQLLLDVQITMDIPTEKGLAMKMDLALPWNKLRAIRRLVCKYHAHCTC